MKNPGILVAAIVVAVAGWIVFPTSAYPAGGPQTLPLDRTGRPIMVLKFGPSMYITYDGSSRAGISFDGSANSVFNSGQVGTSIIRIWCDTDAHVMIETDVTAIPSATTRDTPISAGLPAYASIAASNDRFAVIQRTAAGTCWFTPLE